MVYLCDLLLSTASIMGGLRIKFGSRGKMINCVVISLNQ